MKINIKKFKLSLIKEILLVERIVKKLEINSFRFASDIQEILSISNLDINLIRKLVNKIHNAKRNANINFLTLEQYF